MDIISLKRKHKKRLVESTFRIYQASNHSSLDVNFWTDKLIEGYNFKTFLTEVKNGEIEFNNTIPIGEIRIVDETLEFYAGLTNTITIDIKNNTLESWITSPEKPINASYHLYNADGSLYDYDGLRTPIHVDASTSKACKIKVKMPSVPGVFNIALTLVHEGVAWMEDMGLVMATTELRVLENEGHQLSHLAKMIYLDLVSK